MRIVLLSLGKEYVNMWKCILLEAFINFLFLVLYTFKYLDFKHLYFQQFNLLPWVIV